METTLFYCWRYSTGNSRWYVASPTEFLPLTEGLQCAITDGDFSSLFQCQPGQLPLFAPLGDATAVNGYYRYQWLSAVESKQRVRTLRNVVQVA